MVVIILFALIGVVISDTTITINTNLGQIKGVTSSFTTNNTSYKYNVFKKIPYAKPPIGDLRFRNPEPFGPWNGTLDATEFGPSCIQISYPQFDNFLPNTNQSEDCLLLNIYTPVNVSTLKTVMIWIHGGGFQIGQGMLYDGSFLSGVGDVIVVTINYRLEALGFFSSGNDVAPGNYGLWDQQLAIKWVHDNIESFGGDPNWITIFGQSAGGLSVGLQALYAGNDGLFRRVIAQSGIGNSILAIKTFPRFEALELVQLVNCSNDLTSDSMSCLRNKTVEEIHNANMIILKRTMQLPNVHTINPFAPVVDGKFLIDTPQNILNGKGMELMFYRSLDIMIGNCDAEGSILVDSLIGRSDVNVTIGIPSDFLCNHIILPLTIDYYNNNTQVAPAICKKYKSNGTIQEQSQNSVNFYGDVFFYSPAVSSLNIHSSQNTQSNHFQYINKRIPTEFSNGIPWFHGARHGSELFYLFPLGLLINGTEDDHSFSMTMVKYWSNFAKTG